MPWAILGRPLGADSHGLFEVSAVVGNLQETQYPFFGPMRRWTECREGRDEHDNQDYRDGRQMSAEPPGFCSGPIMLNPVNPVQILWVNPVFGPVRRREFPSSPRLSRTGRRPRKQGRTGWTGLSGWEAELS